MLKVGVLGAGHLGKIHLKLLQQSSKYQLVGFYDPSEENAKKVAEEFGYTSYNSIDELIDAVDVVDIVTPTLSHFECAKNAIEKGLQYAYRDRRNKKRAFRRLWIARINAGARQHGLSYSKFMFALKENNIELNSFICC